MKNFALFLTLFFLSSKLLATDCIPNCEYQTDWTLEVRGAYYQPCSKAFRNVYTNHLLDYQVETSKRINPFCEFFGSVNWASKQGYTRKTYGEEGHKFRDVTKIFVLPISLGFKLIYPILPFVDIYMGAGVSYSFLRIKNFCKDDYSYWGIHHSPFKKETFKHNCGALFKVGFQFAMSDSTFLDFFVDYYSQYFHFSRHESHNIFKHWLDCSGFKYGIGFGVYF